MSRIFLQYIFILLSPLILFENSVLGSHNEVKSNETSISVVVIDPGHGGKDAGANLGTVREKDIVLDIALKLGKQIQQNYPGIKVIYTRSKDIFIPLHKRAEIANKNNADLFISLHVNAVDAKSVQGTETFVLGLHRNADNLEVAKKENSVILLEDDYETTYEDFDPNLPESYIMFETMQEEYREQSVSFASNIQNEFRDYAGRIDRSVKQAGFLVLRRTTMPGVLIETGFLSHANERSYLTSESGKSNLALSIFRAFEKYKTEIEEKSRFQLVTETTLPEEIEGNENVFSSNPTNANKPKSNIYFSVQIIALTKKIEPIPINFKGETEIFRVDDSVVNRYFSGKFDTMEGARTEKERLTSKYPSAFVVAFENDKLISVKKALETR